MSLNVKNLKIKYDNKNIVDNVSFTVETGEVFTILGPSGSGKTTLLDSIAGLKQLTSGQILFNNFDVTQTVPQKRNVGYVFQDYALYPHLTVSKNIGLPLMESESLKNKIKTKNLKLKRKISLLNNSSNLRDLFEYQQLICEQIENQIKDIHDIYFSNDEKIIKELSIEVEAIAAAKIKREDETLLARMSSALFDQARVYYFDEYIKIFEETKNIIIGLKNKENNQMIKNMINMILKTFDYEWLQKYKYLSKKNNGSFKTQLNLFKHEINQAKKSETEIETYKQIISIESINEMKQLVLSAFDVEITEVKSLTAHKIYSFETSYQDFKKILVLNTEPAAFSKEEFKNEKTKLNLQIENIQDIRNKMVMDVATKVDIVEHLYKKPNQLSWGQQQRVAIARAIVKVPDVLLMDEALSHLDYQLKSSTRRWFKEFQRKMHITTIAVTHDQSEAMSMSDKIAVLNKGKIIQFGTPREIYNNPINKFVAEFVGSPKTNIINAVAKNSKIKIQDVEFKTKTDGEVFVGVRPEDIILGNKFKGQVFLIEDMGNNKNVSIKFEDTIIIGVFESAALFEINQEIKFDFKQNKLLIFEKENDQKLIEVI